MSNIDNHSIWCVIAGGWTTYCLPLDAHSFSELKWEESTTLPAGPAFYKAEFETPNAMDTFLATKGWTKGIACALSCPETSFKRTCFCP